MKPLLYFFILTFSKVALSQNIVVLDSITGAPIDNVNVFSEKFGTTSNKSGQIDLDSFGPYDTLSFSHISYNVISIIKSKLNSDVILLSPKSNLLPDITLNDEKKIAISENMPVFTINTKEISYLPQSTSDLLSNESSIVVQESQSGGGSPNYRGMEANRLLLVVDGSQLNNAIYRSGHIQSASTINPFFLQSVKLISGPASVIYGNGAMGGGIIFKTLSPFGSNSLDFLQQYESSSNTSATSLAKYYNINNVYSVSAFSIKSTGNLKMGGDRKHGYSDWGNEHHIINDGRQLYTSFDQVDLLHKSVVINQNNNYIVFNTQYSRSSDVYRFDKMNDVKENLPKYKSWYYGPQVRFFKKISYNGDNKKLLFDNFKSFISFQNIKESRHFQKQNDTYLNNRYENVKVYDLNIDFNKTTKVFDLIYGMGARYQNVNSTANLTSNYQVLYNTTRYPDDGSQVSDFFAYSQVKIAPIKKLDLSIGMRWNSQKLMCNFNNLDFDLNNIKTSNSSFIKSILLSYKPINHTILSCSYYDGFRNPNVDDIGKVFSKDGENVVVPNADLEPEYAQNIELSLVYVKKPFDIKIQVFKSFLNNAISREFGLLNGLDSLLYDGEIMRVQTNQNIESATIEGISVSGCVYMSNNFKLSSIYNFLRGEKNTNEPLAHIPPENFVLSLEYRLEKHQLELFMKYNGWKNTDDYDLSGVDNLDEATSDGNPSWSTVNCIYNYNLNKSTSIMLGVKNIFDQHYKTFASGISASGRNVVLSIRKKL